MGREASPDANLSRGAIESFIFPAPTILKIYLNIRRMLSRLSARIALRGSGFDPVFYRENYVDMANPEIDPYEHFHFFGRKEGRLPRCPDLDQLIDRKTYDPQKPVAMVVFHAGSRTGAPILGYNLALNLSEKYNVICLFLSDGPVVAACTEQGMMVALCRDLSSVGLSPELLLKRLLASFPLKFAVVNSIESRVVLPALASLGVRVVTLVHEFSSYTRPKGAIALAASLSGCLVFSTELTRNNALADNPGLEEYKFPVIAQGVCVVPPLPRESYVSEAAASVAAHQVLRPEGFPEEGVVVLGAGFVQMRKGVDIFIQCAAKVAREAPDLPIRFVWVGGGYDPISDLSYSVYLKDQMERSGLQDRILMCDEVPDLSPMYGVADLFLLTSRLDPMPNVAIDALVGGLPVLCFEGASGIADILCKHGLGEECVASYLDIAEMAGKIIGLAGSRSARHLVAKRSARLAAELFDMRRYVAEIESLAIAASTGRKNEALAKPSVTVYR